VLIGAHVRDDDPIGAAAAREAEIVQFFLSDPQSYSPPSPHPQADQLVASELEVYVHAPYRLNVASPNNRIRIPSRKLVAQHAEGAATVGAKGLIVHGGYVGAGADVGVGIDNWRKFLARQAAEGGFAVPILIENTAGGDGAIARRFDVVARLWDAIGEFGPGLVLDTCHAWAAGEDLVDAVDRLRGITGRVDLVHLNNSRDPFESSRDRHANIADGTIDPAVLAAVVSAAQAPVVVETPSEGQAADIAYLRTATNITP
jgi:deoxyribonuclease IV